MKRNKDTKIIEVSQELFENVCSIKIDDKPLITVSTLEKLSDTTEFRNSRVTDLSQHFLQHQQVITINLIVLILTWLPPTSPPHSGWSRDQGS